MWEGQETWGEEARRWRARQLSAGGFESAFAQLQVPVEAACTAEGEWPYRIAAGIRAALAFAAADPIAAQALTNGALAHGAEGFARYNRMLNHFGERLVHGRMQRPEGPTLPEITEWAMVGGLATLIAEWVDTGKAAELPTVAPEAIQFVLTPYIGVEEAKRVARGGSA